MSSAGLTLEAVRCKEYSEGYLLVCQQLRINSMVFPDEPTFSSGIEEKFSFSVSQSRGWWRAAPSPLCVVVFRRI